MEIKEENSLPKMSSETNNHAGLTGSKKNPQMAAFIHLTFGIIQVANRASIEKKETRKRANVENIYDTGILDEHTNIYEHRHTHTHLRMFVAHNAYICLSINKADNFF